MGQHNNIIIISDENSWINLYIPQFICKLQELGHKVIHRHSFDTKKSYDIAFLLSFSEIVSSNFLKLNKHNLVVHESALPQGKGWSPLSWEILSSGGGGAVFLLLYLKLLLV